jgi:serine protease Do
MRAQKIFYPSLSFRKSRRNPKRWKALGASALVLALGTSMAMPADARLGDTPPGSQQSINGGFADLVEQITPAVVNISTRGKTVAMQGAEIPKFEFAPGSDLERLFKRFFHQHQRGLADQNEPSAELRAQGSGFIIDPAGWVVTSNHVIDGAKEISVILNDGTQYPATIKGRDPKTDLALLKIDADHPLPSVQLGDSDSARPGDWVLAIGNPFGLGGTVTTGIISARSRDIHSGPFDDFLQIDAAINQGNSGGPLFDTQGRVIGINNAIFSPNGGSVGIGFAIPSSLAKPVIAQLRQHGEVQRGWLGVEIQSLSDQLAEGLGMGDDKGALVAAVVPDSPAARAGVEVGDVIVEFDGKPVDKVKDLPWLVANTQADARVPLTVWRKGKRQTLNTVIGHMPDDQKVATSSAVRDGDAQQAGQLGLGLAELTPQAQQQYDVEDTVQGALVVQVRSDSPAARAGLRPGDIIRMVDRVEVRSPADVARQVDQATSAKRHSLLLLVHRDGHDAFMAVPLSKA